MVGRHDDHGVDVGALDDAFVLQVSVAAFVRAAGGFLGVSFFDGRLGPLPLGAIDIANGEHLHIGAAAHVPLVAAHHQTHADETHADAVAGRVLPDHGGRNKGGEGEGCAGHGRVLQKVPAIGEKVMFHGCFVWCFRQFDKTKPFCRS